jgi:hypothetical protein
MAGLTPLDAILIAGLWIWALWGRLLRSGRTLALLAITTALYVLISSELTLLLSVGLRVAVLASAIWILLFRSEHFAVIPAKVFRFDEAFRAELQEVARAARGQEAGRLEPTAVQEQLNAVAKRLRQLDPPDAEWSALRDQTVAYLMQHGRLMEGLGRGVVPAPDALAANRGELVMIEKEYRRLRTADRRTPLNQT